MWNNSQYAFCNHSLLMCMASYVVSIEDKVENRAG